jgi:hypothetical protein
VSEDRVAELVALMEKSDSALVAAGIVGPRTMLKEPVSAENIVSAADWLEKERNEMLAYIAKLEQERDQYKLIAELNRDTIMAMQEAKQTWELIARSRERS